jgi:hypothetical protein
MYRDNVTLLLIIIRTIYIYKNVLSVCARVPLCPQISESASRWRWNLDTTLQANTRVVRLYIYMKKHAFKLWRPRDGTGVNGTQARSRGPGTQRASSGKSHIPKLTQEQNTGDGESYVDVVNKP